MKKSFFVFFSVMMLAQFSMAQRQAAPFTLRGGIAQLDSLRSRLPVEKLYLQTDKPNYTAGDTLWFKAYLLNADFLTPSARSGLLYTELDDANNHMVKKIMTRVVLGMSRGNMALALDKETGLPPGSYTLRAYTSWQRNFGEDYMFSKSFYVSPAGAGSTLITANFKLEAGRIFANLYFTDINKEPLRMHDLQLKIKEGKRTIHTGTVHTGVDGKAALNFDITDKTVIKNLYIEARDITRGEAANAGTVSLAGTTIINESNTGGTLTIPVTLNRREKTDLQFMAEGGSLVAAIPTRVAFKAISEDGRGTDVSGKIYNSKQQQVTVFKSLHKGMGSFELNPETGESYTARIDGQDKSYPLPQINQAGTALRIDSKGTDSLTITATNTINKTATAPATATYYLIAQSRGVVCYAEKLDLNSRQQRTIAKSLLPTGISRFTLLNQNRQPLNERIVFIDHHDQLNISIRPDRTAYGTRDSVSLAIEVKNKDGKPVQGSFSLAVTDDAQVRQDSAAATILSSMLLTSDLKGTVEDPGYYFNGSVIHQDELDNLLLTQGWVGYDWKQVFDPKPLKITYPAEKEYEVKGKVVNVFGTPIQKSNVILFSRKPAIMKDTLTGKDGRFTFNGISPVDTAIFKLQARNRNDKSMNVQIRMDDTDTPKFKSINPNQAPWYVNSDSIVLNNTHTKMAQTRAEAKYRGGGKMLKAVQIKGRKIVKKSMNLNGPGESDYALDVRDMERVGKMSLWDILKNHRIQSYYIILDGIALADLHSFDPVGILKWFTAEDILGVEVMTSTQFTEKYAVEFLSSSKPPFPPFLEITTRAGLGPWGSITPGIYLYKPLAFTIPKQFYSPKYTAENKGIASGTDLRSSIYWQADVVTDTTGRTKVSFYSADDPSKYNIIMEGIDITGDVGKGQAGIKIITEKNPPKK